MASKYQKILIKLPGGTSLYPDQAMLQSRKNRGTSI
jgi:hypothetical protein